MPLTGMYWTGYGSGARCKELEPCAHSHAHTAASTHGIDLAPMLDFAVNLLIFFIVTAVFIKQAGLEVARPTGLDVTAEAPSKSFAVDSSGEISVDGKKIDVRAVRAHIEQFRAANPDGGGVVVAADRGAPMGVIVRVVDEIHLGGIYDVTFTTTETSGAVVDEGG